jgi:hypothetical protein
MILDRCCAAFCIEGGLTPKLLEMAMPPTVAALRAL